MKAKKPVTPNSDRPKLLRLPAVCELVGLSKTSIYAAMAKDGGQGFPTPVRIGCRAVAWREHEVSAWIESRTNTKEAAK